jgi:uncharacterized protein (DUF2062 family)
MPKKFIRRFLPDHQTIRKQKMLSVFGDLLHDANLWHLNRRSACGAFGLGLFYAFWPLPIQMWLAAASAIPLRVNLPLSVATVWITNPFTMAPIFYAAYLLGAAILGTPAQSFEFELSISWLLQSMQVIGLPFVIGCGIFSVVFSLIGYFGLNILWRWSVRKAWRARKHRKLAVID